MNPISRPSPILCVGLVVWGLLGGCGETPRRPSASAPEFPYGVTVVRQGPSTDVQPELRGPSLLLQGSGPPMRAAFRAHVDAVTDSVVDVVVLAASEPSGGRTPECDRVRSLDDVHSCTTITIPDSRGASLDRLAATIREAEVFYFAGGNQCNYVEWRRSAVHEAVRAVGNRGGVGGGSAGLAIQGAAIYDGCAGSTRSTEALADPYHSTISFAAPLFEWTALERVITDSHFRERDRMGRLLAFVARQTADGTVPFFGLGVNGSAAVVVDAAGKGRVYGGTAYLLRGNQAPDTVRAERPLTYGPVDVVPLRKGARYDFRTRPRTEAAYLIGAETGTLSSSPYETDAGASP